MRCALAVLLVAGAAHAQGDPALGKLEQALPAGWSMMATETELVIRHDRPCYTDGQPPLVTLELRYKLEPKWTAQQLAGARATNDKIAAELKALRAQYRIDQIHAGKPKNDDERARLAAYNTAEAQARGRLVRLPLCTLGASSVFDGDETYAQLRLQIDPPEAMRDAHKIVELVKKQCGAQ